MSPVRGFTLIEVLVALVIMAIALASLLHSSGLAADHSQMLRQRMLAGWMAENRLAALQAGQQPPALGVSRGSFTQDQRAWLWEQEVSASATPKLARLEIRIATPDAAHYWLATLVAYVPMVQE